MFIYLFICLFISSAKKATKIQQKSTAGSCNDTSVLKDSQRGNHPNENEQDDSLFNDDDDDLDITEIDQALLDGKAPLSSQETEEKVDKRINHIDVVKTGAASTSQRYIICCMIIVKLRVILFNPRNNI